MLITKSGSSCKQTFLFSRKREQSSELALLFWFFSTRFMRSRKRSYHRSIVMFCGECGTENKDTSSFCRNCGKALKNPRQAAAPMAPTAPVQPAPSSYYIPPAGATAPGTATPPLDTQTPQVPEAIPVQPAAVGAAKPARNWLAIVSFILALLSWVIYPIIIGIFAMGLGIFSLYSAKKGQSKIPLIAIIAIIIGLLAIVLNFFWLDIFTAPTILPPIK